MNAGNRFLPIFAVVGLAATMSGCGGGGATGMTGGAAMPLEPSEGLTRSEATPVSSSSAADTLAALLPDSTNEFAPLTSSIERDIGESTTTTSESYVKTISSDGANGFHVTFVVGGEEQSVHFEDDDYNLQQGGYNKEVDGVDYWFWSWIESHHGAEKNMGLAPSTTMSKWADSTSTTRTRAMRRTRVRMSGTSCHSALEPMPPACRPAPRATPEP